jgi:hypothetical protein
LYVIVRSLQNVGSICQYPGWDRQWWRVAPPEPRKLWRKCYNFKTCGT